MAPPKRNPAAQAANSDVEDNGESVEVGMPSISTGIVQDIALVANQHAGPIILPRVAMNGDQRIQLPPVILHPGLVTAVPGDAWNEYKKMVVIQHYLDKRLLVEVQVDQGAVPVIDATSTDLQNAIPENLQTEEELGNIDGVSASVVKTNVGSLKV